MSRTTLAGAASSVLVMVAAVSTMADAQQAHPELRTVRGAREMSVTTATLELRAEPPKQFLFFVRGPGEKLATIEPGQDVVLLDEEIVVRSFLEKSLWQKVEIPQGDANAKPIVGWLYAGPVAGDKYVQVVEREER